MRAKKCTELIQYSSTDESRKIYKLVFLFLRCIYFEQLFEGAEPWARAPCTACLFTSATLCSLWCSIIKMRPSHEISAYYTQLKDILQRRLITLFKQKRQYLCSESSCCLRRPTTLHTHLSPTDRLRRITSRNSESYLQLELYGSNKWINKSSLKITLAEKMLSVQFW